MSDNVIEKRDFPVNIEDIMHTAYLQYSLSVNVGRAIPDVRDGLKPCNRRILYAMRQLGLMKSRPHMILTAIPRFTIRWSAWRRIFPCACR